MTGRRVVPAEPNGSANFPAIQRLLKLAFFAAAIIGPVMPVVALTPAGTNFTDANVSEVEEFYRGRQGKPLWFAPASGNAPQQLLKLLGSAEVDGFPRGSSQLGTLVVAIREANGGNPAAIKRAETMLSRAFLTYAQGIQRDPKVGVIYVDAALKPTPSSAMKLLKAAAQAPSLPTYLEQIGWMNPVYGQLRKALHSSTALTDRERYILMLNLQRARALPFGPERYVLVNTANQRLYMFEDGKAVGEMKVVAGRATAQTPLMNAYIRFAVLNPYWNVPADISARLASNVLKRGPSYLKQQGFQVISDSGGNAKVVDPSSVDWSAVAAGKVSIQLRQRPGPTNAMGRVKFMFPNNQGIWLHDTPSRQLFDEKIRFESNGCIRLEDAWRLGAWLFRRPLNRSEKGFERKVEMPAAVPVYITYMTAIPRGKAIDYAPDVYQRDFPVFVDNPNASAPRARVGGS